VALCLHRTFLWVSFAAALITYLDDEFEIEADANQL
jgi:hypothetical protein